MDIFKANRLAIIKKGIWIWALPWVTLTFFYNIIQWGEGSFNETLKNKNPLIYMLARYLKAFCGIIEQ